MKIVPVIHYLNDTLSMKNAELCAKHKAFGLFVISMDGDNSNLSSLASKIKKAFPDLKVGINLLGDSALSGVYDSLNHELDMTWSDCPIVTGSGVTQEARIISETIHTTQHLFFNSVAFKYQQVETNIPQAVLNSQSLRFIPTTSGEATGKAADLIKVKLMKEHLGNYPLGIASGLTPENIHEYIPFIEYGLVATGISEDFYTFDNSKLKTIIEKSKS